jgi:hypothetical protein
MASRWVLGTGLLISGCLPPVAEIARVRAAHELGCPAEKVEVTARRDLDTDKRVLDVEACGKVARYAVLRQYEFAIREPDPDPAALAAFKAASRPSPSQ